MTIQMKAAEQYFHVAMFIMIEKYLNVEQRFIELTSTECGWFYLPAGTANA